MNCIGARNSLAKLFEIIKHIHQVLILLLSTQFRKDILVCVKSFDFSIEVTSYEWLKRNPLLSKS